MTGGEIVAEAREWLGTPYQHQASLKGIACDCIGYVGGVGVAKNLPSALAWKNDSAFKGYGPEPKRRVLLEGCAKYFKPIRLEEAKQGDVLVMGFEGEPMHFAIVSEINPMYVIHALRGVGKVAEHRVDQLWHSRIYRAFRFLEV